MSGTTSKILAGDLVAGGVSLRGVGKRVAVLEGAPAGASDIDDLGDATTTADSLSMGAGSMAGVRSVGVGINAVCTSTVSVAVGEDSQCVGGTSSVAVGSASRANVLQGTAVGNTAAAVNDESTAVGWNAQANGVNSTAIGRGTFATTNAVALGRNATATSANTLAINVSGTATDSLETDLLAVTGASALTESAHLVVRLAGLDYHLPLLRAPLNLRMQLTLDSDFTDSSGNGFNGTATGVDDAPTFASFGVHNYASFTYTDITESAAVTFPQPLTAPSQWGGQGNSPYTGVGWTMMCWLNAQSVPPGNDFTPLAVGDSSGTFNQLTMGFSVQPRGLQVAYSWFKWAGYNPPAAPAPDVAVRDVDTWVHLAATFDPATETLLVYADGGNPVNYNLPVGAMFGGAGFIDGTTLYMGGMRDGEVVGFGSRYEGFIDDVRIYEQVLPQCIIAEIVAERQ